MTEKFTYNSEIQVCEGDAKAGPRGIWIVFKDAIKQTLHPLQ